MTYFELYRSAHNNALDLLTEAQLLFDNGRYARAYALAFTALEEIAKSQLAADVFTGYINEEKFRKIAYSHPKKIERMAWATEAAYGYLTEDERKIEPDPPLFGIRNDSMYTNLAQGKVITPKDEISKDKAEGIIHTVEAALKQIYFVTEHMGHQIGTKGFMK